MITPKEKVMEKNEKNSRRKAIKTVLATLAVGLGVTKVNAAEKRNQPLKKVAANITKSDEVPLFSGHTIYGNMVFIAGKGYHQEGDITVHTDHVLNSLEEELIKAGSSMDKVLKVNVYLHDLNDYKAMNELYKGRFGDNPPVRTTVAVFGGVPGNSLVEIDCIAYKD
jgi:2-iminobutanoate/2-iminopropanoate deaminase